MKNNKTITFVPTWGHMYKDVLSEPVPAAQAVPQWYKDLARHVTSNDLSHLGPINDRGGDGSNVSTKLCLPFFDAMTMGYYYCLDSDVFVSLDIDGKPTINWSHDTLLVDKRPEVDMAIPDDVHPLQFGVKMQWFYETPKGYSLLMTMPMNRPELPFWSPSGVVDADIWGLPAFIPLYIKKNFEGTIPKGTPIFQFIPIKREEWNLEIDDSDKTLDRHELMAENRRSHITAHYRKFAWRKKRYM